MESSHQAGRPHQGNPPFYATQLRSFSKSKNMDIVF